MEPHSALNNLDLIVIGIIVLSGLLALMRGFTREIFSLLAWAGAYFAAVRLYPLVTPWMHHYVKNDKGAEWAAMAAVFVVAFILLMVAGTLVATLIKGRALTIIDRSLGFLFGLVRGALVVSLIYLGAVMIFWPDIDKSTSVQIEGDQAKDKDRNTPPELLVDAKTRPLLAYGAAKLMVFVPQDMIDKTLKGVEARKVESEKAAEQKALDRLSTPAPPSANNGADSIETNRIQGTKQ
jgi:membrane protein required for colicin V production